MVLDLTTTNTVVKTKEDLMLEASKGVFDIIKHLHIQIEQGLSLVSKIMATNSTYTTQELRTHMGSDTTDALDDIALQASALLQSVKLND